MPRIEEFRIPDLSAILEKSKKEKTLEEDLRAETYPKKPEKGRTLYQSIFPKDPGLAEKLGITREDLVFIFAGGYGDWANSLSKACNVVYSDLSKDMVQYTLQKYPNLKEGFCVAEGVLLPLPKNTDWLFSFEPIPLENAHLPMVLLQGMANCRKGVMIAYGCPDKKLSERIREMAKLYEAPYDGNKVQIIKTNPSLSPDNVWEVAAYLCKLETTPAAKSRSTLDLELILYLQKKRVGTVKICNRQYPAHFFDGIKTDAVTADALAKLGETLDKNKDEILESLRRINKLSASIEDYKCLQTVRVLQ